MAKSTPVFTIKSRLFLVAKHTDGLSWYITAKQQLQMFFQTLNIIINKTKCNARVDPVLHHRLYSNSLDISGKLSYEHRSLEQPEPSK